MQLTTSTRAADVMVKDLPEVAFLQ